ncbi:MAG TPA: hypothetical protein VK492_07985 [Chitinophagaceae bacterium]|nr:hypothetical protein [Chitinophagaceae bacterium]
MSSNDQKEKLIAALAGADFEKLKTMIEDRKEIEDLREDEDILKYLKRIGEKDPKLAGKIFYDLLRETGVEEEQDKPEV